MGKGKTPMRGSSKKANRASSSAGGGRSTYRVEEVPGVAPNPAGNRAERRAAAKEAKRRT